MANLTRSISSKMPKGPRQEIPTKTPRSGRSRTKQAAWKREQASTWQPIETAPEEDVLLYFRAVISSGGHMDLRPMYQIGQARHYPNRKPTGWMPLPAFEEKRHYTRADYDAAPEDGTRFSDTPAEPSE